MEGQKQEQVTVKKFLITDHGRCPGASQGLAMRRSRVKQKALNQTMVLLVWVARHVQVSFDDCMK